MSTKLLSVNSFHKGLGAIHIWCHHPLGGSKNWWPIGVKKCWRTEGSGQWVWQKVVTSYMDSPLRIVLLLQNSYDQSFFFTKFWGIIKLFLSEYWCGNKLVVNFILYLWESNPYNTKKLPASHGKVNSVQEALRFTY